MHTVTWSPDGLQLAATTWEDPIRIWDASIADRYLKSQGDLRAKASAMKSMTIPEAIDLLERLRKLHPEEEERQLRGYCDFDGPMRHGSPCSVRSTGLSPSSNN